jgi:glycosyltransferase involved in cell wall biosynthesis
VELAESAMDQGVPVSLVIIKNKGQRNWISPRLNIIELNAKSTKASFFKVLFCLYKEKPKYIFSSLFHLNLFMAVVSLFYMKKHFLICRETSIPSEKFKKNSFTKNKFIFILYRLFSFRFSKIIFQSEYMRNDFSHNFNISVKKTSIVRNPVNQNKILALSSEYPAEMDKNKFKVLFVGRFEKVKGLDRLFEAIKILKKENIHFYLLGQGSLLSFYKNFASTNNLKNFVSFVGQKNNPFPYMKEADLLVLTSYHEGSPNVIQEAAALGTPTLAMNSPGGTQEIINALNCGFLVENGNIQDFSNKLLELKNIKHKLTFRHSEFNTFKKAYDQIFPDKASL